MSPDLARRVVARYMAANLEVGRTIFTEGLRIHRYADNLRITDMVNAGKRGKKVDEMNVGVSLWNDDQKDTILKAITNVIVHDDSYQQAKAHVVKLQAEHPEIKFDEISMRGIDVEPMGTTIKLSDKFPNGTILSIQASPHSFQVSNSVPFGGENGKPSFRQDTLYWPVKKTDGIIFYGWLKDNISKAAKMDMSELRQTWEALGVRWNSH